MYLRNLNLTVTLLSTWESYIKYRMTKRGFFTDQEELNALLKDLKKKRKNPLISEDLNLLKVSTLDWDEFPSGVNYFLVRRKGKGKFSKTCQSKVCEKLIWVPKTHMLTHNKFEGKNYIIHHNHAKSNELKIQRAKEAGIWLELSPDNWCISCSFGHTNVRL